MTISINNSVGIGDNQFPTKSYMDLIENRWVSLSNINEIKVNFLDDERVQMVIPTEPFIMPTSIFRIEFPAKGAKSGVKRFYQVEKIDKVANNKLVIRLTIEPYLTYILAGRDIETHDNDQDIGTAFASTLLDYIRSPYLTLQSLALRDPLMDAIIKGCNRIPVYEQTYSREHLGVDTWNRRIKIEMSPSRVNPPILSFSTEGDKTAWREWYGRRNFNTGMQGETTLGFYVNKGDKLPLHSTKYAVFVIPADDWRLMCVAGGAWGHNRPLGSECDFSSNSGWTGIAHRFRSNNENPPFVFVLSTFKGLKIENHYGSDGWAKILNIPITADGQVWCGNKYQYLNIPSDNYAFNIPYDYQDVVIKIPLFETTVYTAFEGKWYTDGKYVRNNLYYLYRATQENKYYNTMGYIQKFLMTSGEIYGPAFKTAKNLKPYFKGVFHGQCYNKNQTPIAIGVPEWGNLQNPPTALCPNQIFAFLSPYNEGEEWEIDIYDFQTFYNRKSLGNKLDNVIGRWGVGSQTYLWDPNTRQYGWGVNHIYLKQYLDFSIGSEPMNLSLILGCLYGSGNPLQLARPNAFQNKQKIKIKTYFINGFIHNWFFPSSGGYMTTGHTFSSRSGYASLSALSEYQAWLTANANVLESGKTNAFTSMITGIATGLSNLAVGGINATWAPDIGSAFTGAAPNVAGGFNNMLTSITNYTNTVRSINAQKADAKNSSGSQLLGASTEFIQFDMLSRLGVIDMGDTSVQIGNRNSSGINNTHYGNSIEFRQTAMVNDLTNLIPKMKQTLYYNGYYGPVFRSWKWGEKINDDLGNTYSGPRYFELVDDNTLFKINSTIIYDTKQSTIDSFHKGYEGQRWITWFINKLSQGVMFYNDENECVPINPTSELKEDKPKEKTKNVSKKKTKKN